MKKLVVQYINDNGFNTFDEFYANKIESLNEEDLATLISVVQSATSNGDIWYKCHYQEDNANYFTYIFDSQDAVDNFAPVLSIFETSEGYVSTNITEMSFEEFATYAATRQESDNGHERIKLLRNS